MQMNQRPLAATGLVLALTLAACGGAASTSAPATQAPGATGAPAGTLPAATTGGAAGELGANIQALGADVLAPVFGASIPTPTCDVMGDSGFTCRWMVNDGELLVDADADASFETEAAWREAFGSAGFDEEIPGIGVAALGGDNPLSDGWRASAYTSDGIAYSVTVNKAGDVAAVKAMVIAILTKLAS